MTVQQYECEHDGHVIIDTIGDRTTFQCGQCDYKWTPTNHYHENVTLRTIFNRLIELRNLLTINPAMETYEILDRMDQLIAMEHNERL